MSPQRAPGEALPEAALKHLLQGPGMDRPLAAVLRPLKLQLVGWTHLRTHHRPGAGLSALYRVQAQPRATASGALRRVQLQVGATTAALPPSRSAATVGATLAGTAIRLWVHPRDPVLSGLPWATNPAAVARGVFNSDTVHAALAVVAYRPLRRAVIRADHQGQRVFLKVPQPQLAAGQRQRLMQAAVAGLPVPPLLDTSPGTGSAAEDVLVLGVLPGQSLHGQLRGAAEAVLDPEGVIDLLDRLPAAVMGFSRRPAWADRVLDYAGGAAVALPEETERITRCARNVAEIVRSTDPGPLVPVHGDFHGGNLLARRAGSSLEISGLLDVDALGPGHRVDDLACFLGHLRVLSALHPAEDGLATAAERFTVSFGQAADSSALYGRSAGVALSLVAGAAARGPQAARQALAAAEELLRGARPRR